MGRSNSATVDRAREAATHLEDMTTSSEPHKLGYVEQLAAEAQSWVSPDAGLDDKLLRERIRHYSMIRSLLLDKLPTHRMDVIEVGGGPLPVSDLLDFRSRRVIDPCSDEYRRIAPCPDHITAQIESYSGESADLIIATNSLDHVQDAPVAFRAMDALLRPGGYMAILCNENNASVHVHPSHKINLTIRDIHAAFDADYETAHELTYERDGLRYGWVLHEGRRGQPCFAWLGRKATYA